MQFVVHQCNRILYIELGCGCVELLFERGHERITQILQHQIAAVHVVVITGQRVVAGFSPDTGIDAVHIVFPGQVGNSTVAADAVFGSADGDRCAILRSLIRCEPVALTGIAVVVAGQANTEVAEYAVQCGAHQCVFTQTCTLIVGIIHIIHTACVNAFGSIDCALPVRCIVIPVVAETVHHFQRQILIVGFFTVRVIDERAQFGIRAQWLYQFAVDHVLILAAVTFPFVGALTGVADIRFAAGAQNTSVCTQESAGSCIAAHGFSSGKFHFICRCRREKLYCTAQVTGRCCAN